MAGRRFQQLLYRIGKGVLRVFCIGVGCSSWEA